MTGFNCNTKGIGENVKRFVKSQKGTTIAKFIAMQRLAELPNEA